MHTLTRDDGFSLDRTDGRHDHHALVTAATLTTFKNAIDINDTAGAARRREPEPARRHQPAGPRPDDGRTHHRGRKASRCRLAPAPIDQPPGPPGSTLTSRRHDPTTTRRGCCQASRPASSSVRRSTARRPTWSRSSRSTSSCRRAGRSAGSGSRRRRRDGTDSAGCVAADAAVRRRRGWSAIPSTTRRRSASAISCSSRTRTAMRIQTVTVDGLDAHHRSRRNSVDWFHFNQRSDLAGGTVLCLKADTACDMLPVALGVPVDPGVPGDGICFEC